MTTPTILDYYKYSVLATASYVRMGGLPLDGASFSAEAAKPENNRLPLPQGNYWFDPQNTYQNPVWQILNYYGGDIPADPNNNSTEQK